MHRQPSTSSIDDAVTTAVSTVLDASEPLGPRPECEGQEDDSSHKRNNQIAGRPDQRAKSLRSQHKKVLKSITRKLMEFRKETVTTCTFETLAYL